MDKYFIGLIWYHVFKINIARFIKNPSCGRCLVNIRDRSPILNEMEQKDKIKIIEAFL